MTTLPTSAHSPSVGDWEAERTSRTAMSDVKFPGAGLFPPLVPMLDIGQTGAGELGYIGGRDQWGRVLQHPPSHLLRRTATAMSGPAPRHNGLHRSALRRTSECAPSASEPCPRVARILKLCRLALRPRGRATSACLLAGLRFVFLFLSPQHPPVLAKPRQFQESPFCHWRVLGRPIRNTRARVQGTAQLSWSAPPSRRVLNHILGALNLGTDVI